MGFQGLSGFGGGATGLSLSSAGGDLGASGGVVGEYTDPGPGNVYRVHLFQSPGTFVVESPAVTAVEYLVVAGGGGGSEGANSGGGGGAGGFRTNVPGTPGSHTTTVAFPVSTSPGEYSVTVGQGGIGASAPPGGYRDGFNGADSSFGPITADGGGWGGGETPTTATGNPGGSGGGGSTTPGSTVYPGGATIAVTTPSPWPGPATQGTAGGSGQHVPGVWESGGGGGGAGNAGQNSTQPTGGGDGGIGIRSPITGPAYAIGYDGSPTSLGGWVGGGGAGYYDLSPDSRGGGGGWDGSSELPGTPLSGGGDASGFGYPGRTNSGGGGGSCGPTQEAGNGGPGIVAIRYQISAIGGTSQATGGNVSFYEGKTIHAFTSSGSLVCPTSISSVEYVIVGGGGGGGAGTGASPNGYAAGGGGAGQYLEGSGVTLPATTYPVTVGEGGNRWVRYADPSSTNNPTNEGKGEQGGASTFNSLTAGGGGYGGNYSWGAPAPPFSGGDGMSGSPAGKGSGGGKCSYDNGPAGAGSGGPGGYPGGSNPPTSISAGAGGGGAGGAGQDGADGLAGGKGGVGLQLPATFRDPKARYGRGPGDPAPYHWVAGGGAGGSNQPASPGSNAASGAGGGGVNGTEPFPSAPEAQSTPYAGGGYGGYATGPTDVKSGGDGAFGGGGGGAGSWGGGGYAEGGGNGGMGIILIAYPT